MGSPDTWRDVRRFSLKFYTDEGNYDYMTGQALIEGGLVYR